MTQELGNTSFSLEKTLYTGLWRERNKKKGIEFLGGRDGSSISVCGHILAVFLRVLEMQHYRSEDMRDGREGMPHLSNKLFCVSEDHMVLHDMGCR